MLDPDPQLRRMGGAHDPADEAAIAALMSRLAADAKAYARAEADVVRHTALYRFGTIKPALVAGAVALVIALSAVTALLVGLILSLATLIGPLGATAVVVLLTLAIAGLLVRYAAGRFAMLGKPIPSSGGGTL